ncbi:hypothetical protein [Thiolinea disciformis]|uniref:hypothetical protein n=1 Tax=Thiolinea disciformis TaxID=125614 RepID=UPI000366B52F|nr:hypothetical protein [Thiolinea disciformis]
MTDSIIKKRGRPKGAISASLAEVRSRAAEDLRQQKLSYETRILELKASLEECKSRYSAEIQQLKLDLDLSRRREQNYQQALSERLNEMVAYLQESLINWGKAELEEAQIDKRKRGRPRKTIKAK